MFDNLLFSIIDYYKCLGLRLVQHVSAHVLSCSHARILEFRGFLLHVQSCLRILTTESLAILVSF